MSFGFAMLNVLSLFLLVATFGISFFKWKAPGAIHFGMLVVFSFVWALGTFIELSVTSFEAKLFWRNFTQIGVFLLPVSTIIFALAHTGTSRRVTRVVDAVLNSWQIIVVFLIWTDGIHHLMRASVSLGVGTAGLVVPVVRQTVLGMICVSINYVMMVVAISILVISALRRPATRTSVLIIAAGLAIPGVASMLTNMFGPMVFGGIPAAMSLAVGAMVALVGIQYFGFLKLTPIARDRAFDVIDEGILVSDADGKVVDLNQAARTMLSRNYSLPKDAPPSDFGRRLSQTLDATIPELCSQKELRFNLKLAGGDAKVNYVLHSYELRNDKRLIGYTSVLQDVSEETHRMNRLLERAERDSLTGIYNKQAFNEIVTDLLERTPAGTAFLMIFDIDHFKKFNDEYGHLPGDTLIQEVCRRCQGNLRDGDIFGRVGGDEFAVFLTGLDAGSAYTVAERIRESIASGGFAVGTRTASITISAGLTVFDSKGLSETSLYTFEDLFKKADAALYASKAAGRNCVRFFDT